MFKVFFISLFFISMNTFSSTYEYVEKQFIHLHKNKSINSITLVTLSCGQRVQVLSSSNGWVEIKSGSYKGYSLSRNLSKKNPECLGQKYSKIYNGLDLTMLDIYKMGRLEDLFIHGEIKL